MKRNFIIILFLIINCSICQAKDNISADSLLTLFQAQNVYDVFNYIGKNIRSIPIDSIRVDMRFKPYFMKAMDKKSYYMRYMNKKQQEVEGRISDEDVIYFLRHDMKRNHGIDIENVDSIMSDPQLYRIYRDSVLNKRMGYEKRDFRDSFPTGILFVLERLRYPEAYEVIKEEWIKRGKRIKIVNWNDPFLISLLWYNDPEAWEVFFDKKVEEMVKTNGKTEYFEDVTQILYDYAWKFHPYTVEKSLKMLNINREVKLLSYKNIMVPYWKFILFTWAEGVGWGKRIYIDKDEDYIDKKDSIIEKAKKYIEESREKDAEWMKDIPYFHSANEIKGNK